MLDEMHSSGLYSDARLAGDEHCNAIEGALLWLFVCLACVVRKE